MIKSRRQKAVPVPAPKLPKSTYIHLKDGHPVTTSRIVAEVFGKRHFHVTDAIEALECSQEFKDTNFRVYSYKSENAKRSYKAYEITRDGFMILVMGFTGKKAAQFKEQYIAEFNKIDSGYGITLQRKAIILWQQLSTNP